MNRTDRLYALVEELRSVAPHPRSASWLAARFEVSARTIERDLDALRQSGVPIWSDTGRSGGYTLDRVHTLAPLALTAVEALAVSIALRAVAGSPFADSARTAAQKVLAGLPEPVRRREEALAARVHRVGDHGPDGADPVRRAVEEAVAEGRVVRLDYADAAGARTARDVEPMGLLWGPRGWYLLGWCRWRRAVRGFHLERIGAAEVLDEWAPPREDDLRRELDRIDAGPLGT